MQVVFICNKQQQATEHQLVLLQAGKSKSAEKNMKGKGKAAAAAGSVPAKTEVHEPANP